MNQKWPNFRYETDSEMSFTSAKQPPLSILWLFRSLKVILSNPPVLESKTKPREVTWLAQEHAAR